MTHSERTLEYLEQYIGDSSCESCGKKLGGVKGPDCPAEDCDSFEHEAVWQAHRAEYWRTWALQLNPEHHLHRKELREPDGTIP